MADPTTEEMMDTIFKFFDPRKTGKLSSRAMHALMKATNDEKDCPSREELEKQFAKMAKEPPLKGEYDPVKKTLTKKGMKLGYEDDEEVKRDYDAIINNKVQWVSW